MSDIKEVRCTICASEFTWDELDNISSCPKCGTMSIPCNMKDDVSININWHELRILTIWAENWAKQCNEQDKLSRPNEPFGMPYTVMSICGRLQKQFPEKTKLTLFSEVRELREKYDIKSDIDNDNILE